MKKHHTSWVLETKDDLAWFDTGESCSRTAYLAGINILKTNHIFLSHAHMDHIGGLPLLLWNLAKIRALTKRGLRETIVLHTPLLSVSEHVLSLLDTSEFPSSALPLQTELITPGIICNNPNLTVEAAGTLHVPLSPEGCPRAFCFRIRTEGKTLIYSGDLKDVSELDSWLSEGCDMLMIENGHHTPSKTAEYLAQKQFKIKTFLFLHHGRTMLEHPEVEKAKTRKKWSGKLIFAEELMSFNL